MNFFIEYYKFIYSFIKVHVWLILVAMIFWNIDVVGKAVR